MSITGELKTSEGAQQMSAGLLMATGLQCPDASVYMAYRLTRVIVSYNLE